MKKVLLLFGGNSSEHQISCNSAKSILENIDYSKYNVTAVGITKANEWLEYIDQLENIVTPNWHQKKVKKINDIISL